MTATRPLTRLHADDLGNSDFVALTGTDAPTMLDPVARRLRAMPESHRGTYRRAVSGTSLRAAVDASCAECCGYDRDAVRSCPAVACPLWSVRPWQRKRSNGVEESTS